MARLICTLVMSLTIYYGDLVYAQVNGSDCPKLRSPQAILNCTLQKDTRIRSSKLYTEEAKAEVDQAEQIPNLEFETDISYTDNFGSNQYSTETKLLHTFELGGKRKARVARAEALKRQSFHQDYLAKGNVALETVINLHRARQIREELESVREILQTFKRVQRVYRKRGALGPEQRVSLDVFELAESDQKLIESKLLLELSHIKRDLELSIGQKIEMNNTTLPNSPSKWPELKSLAKKEISDSPQYQVSKENEAISLGELEMAKSSAWPDLTIGPSVGTEFENKDRIYSYGISLSMPLPFYHQNQGEKAIANAKHGRAKLNAERQKARINKERERLIETYDSMVTNLRKMRSHADYHSKHKKVHSYISRGVISSALVIESHRQLLDFLEHKNEVELEALKTLWELYLIDGEILNKEI